jgi:GNAT superfamily N-acetyltransferase
VASGNSRREYRPAAFRALVSAELDFMTDGAHIVPRKLRLSDIPAAMELCKEAGWNQTTEDWRMLIGLSPEGCLAIDVEGVLAATTTLLCYGKRLAWIGMVLTRVPYRGRGYARRLMTEALTLADQTGIETVKLDATDQGQPLYEKLGFRCEQPVERWACPAFGAVQGSSFPETPFSNEWRETDNRAFGVDRSQLLDELARRNPPLATGRSYLLTRPGRLNRYLGPCVAHSPEEARTLIERSMRSLKSVEWFWDLLPRNTSAAVIARDLSFAPKRHLMRMVRGKDLRAQEDAIYAIAGFELG